MRNILFIILFIFASNLCAQQAQTTVTEENQELTDFPESMLSDMDSLYWDWQSKNFLSIDENCMSTATNPIVSDSVYIDRLSRIPSIIEMPFNDIVKKHIEAYTIFLYNERIYV